MKRVLCAVSMMVMIGFGTVIGSVISRPADAQDQTDERLAALETTVAKNTKDLSSVRKRVRDLEDAAETATAAASGGAEPTAASEETEPTAAPTEEAEEAAPPTANTSTTLGGNAVPLLAGGEQGELSVVLAGTYDGNILPVIVRNNTEGDVIRIQVSGVVRSSDGKLIASGGDQGFRPNLVRSGEYAIGYLYFDGVELPGDATYEFDISATDADDDEFESTRDLDVTEAEFLGDRIVGFLQNNHDETVTGPMGVAVVCLDAEGTLLSHHQSYTDKEEAAPGETVPFQVDLYGENDCSNFLVAASGYSF